jgi:hypothetical protein
MSIGKGRVERGEFKEKGSKEGGGKGWELTV